MIFFLNATIFLATDFFFVFYYNILNWFYATGKKYVKENDVDACYRRTEFKAKSKIMKINRNYKKIDMKIRRVLKCKEIVALRDLQNSAFESLFSQIIRIWKLFFRSVGTYVFCKCLCIKRKTALPLSRNKFLLSIRASLVGKTGFSPKTWKHVTIFQQSKIKIIT